MKLNAKIACVTGSVRGIGWEIVQAYAQEGAQVVICDLHRSDVDLALARLGLPLERVLGVTADVTVEEDVVYLFRAIRERFDSLDILVNNAGFAWPREGPIDLELADTPFQVWLKVLNTNLTGTFLCSREALRLMRPQRFGTIINISSPQGKLGRALRGPYSAAKFPKAGLPEYVGDPRFARLGEGGEWRRERYPRLVEWLLRMHGCGAQLGSTCSGVLLLAETGLLDGKDATIHWIYAPTFRRNFPKVRLKLDKALLATGARNGFIMSGASTSWHDLVLYVIAQHVGPTAAQSVAKFFAFQGHADGLSPYVVFEPMTDHGDATIRTTRNGLAAIFRLPIRSSKPSGSPASGTKF